MSLILFIQAFLNFLYAHTQPSFDLRLLKFRALILKMYHIRKWIILINDKPNFQEYGYISLTSPYEFK